MYSREACVPDVNPAPRKRQPFGQHPEDDTGTPRYGVGASRETLADIIQSAHEFIGIAGPDWRPVFVNEAGQRMVGLHGMEDVRRTHVLDFFSEDDQPYVRDTLLPTIMREGRWAGERELCLRHFETGAVIPVLWDAFRLDDPRTGEPVGAATVTRDITERKRAEEQLQAAHERIRDVLDSITDDVAAVDDAWRFTYVNDRALARFSRETDRPLSRHDVLGEVAWDVFPDLVGSPFYDGVVHARHRGRTTEFEAHFPHSRQWLAVRAYPSRTGLIIYSRDITDRKAAEYEVRRRALHQAVIARIGQRALEGATVPQLMTEAVGAVARTLDVAFVLLAEQAGDGHLLVRAGHGWQGPLNDGYLSPARLADTQCGVTLRTGAPVISDDTLSDTRFRAIGTLHRHHVASSATVLLPGRHQPFGVLGVWSTTHRHFRPDEVAFLEAMAQVLATAVQNARIEHHARDRRTFERQTFAHHLADEALSELTHAQSLATDLSRSQRKADAQDQGAHPEALTGSLTTLRRRIESVVHDLHAADAEDAPLHELLRRAVEAQRRLAPDMAIDLLIGEEIPSRPLGQTGRQLSWIITEAIANARRHSAADHVRTSVSVTRNHLVVEVTDNGRGFRPETAPRHSAAGLATARERAQGIGGELHLVSTPGSGTSVRIVVPLPSVPARLSSPTRVLLVDDHTMVREAVATALAKEPDLTVAGQAHSLAHARELLADTDVAVIARGLPDGYGGDLITELRAINPHAKALILTTSLDRPTLAQAIESGAAGVLDKTAQLHEIITALRQLRAGQALLPAHEVIDLLRYAAHNRERAQEEGRLFEQLTAREREVLQALADGLDSAQTAARLHISIRTERNHRTNILAKLQVHSQMQALLLALRHGTVRLGAVRPIM
jgi:PAS domain S-box-containing protein